MRPTDAASSAHSARAAQAAEAAQAAAKAAGKWIFIFIFHFLRFLLEVLRRDRISSSLNYFSSEANLIKRALSEIGQQTV